VGHTLLGVVWLGLANKNAEAQSSTKLGNIAIDEESTCGKDLHFLKQSSLLFVCDLGTKNGDRLEQSEKDDWGYLHYKPGTSMLEAKAGIPGVHRYTACYGEPTDALSKLLEARDGDTRECSSCTRAAELCYGDAENYKVEQFYTSGCNLDSNKMQISKPFGGRPEKQADAHLFTFVLDELKGKNKKKSQEAAKPAKSAPKKKKNAEKEAEDAPFWSNIFADEGKSSLNKIAAKSHAKSKPAAKEPATTNGERLDAAPACGSNHQAAVVHVAILQPSRTGARSGAAGDLQQSKGCPKGRRHAVVQGVQEVGRFLRDLVRARPGSHLGRV